MDINTEIVKEPRGMIRIIQLVFAILAFATTTGFETTTSFNIYCPPTEGEKAYQAKVEYPVEYPFNFERQGFKSRANCSSKADKVTLLKMDFASSAQFYVATGVLSLLYTLGCLVFYMVSYRHYENNPLIPVVDLAATGILTIFWFAGSCAWAAGVSDVKYYAGPNHLIKNVNICHDPTSTCEPYYFGKWSSLHISLIFGFANIFLWGASMWFVFKETTFHKKPVPAGGQANFGQFGDQNQQPQFPQQTQFPQQPQFPQQQQQFTSNY